jgi:aspartyl-tRNA(Asn)/glutamyl-tRNA(Gln) amidotransferase subunit C
MAVDPGIEQELGGLCALACLYLDPAEKEQIARQLNAVIKVLSKIQKVDTTGVEPAVHPAALPVRFREDEVESSLHPDLVFGNTANRSEQYFHVPRIAGDEPDEI